MENKEVVVLMNKYVETKTQVAQLDSEKKKLIEQAMPKEVRDKVKDIETEFEGKAEKAQQDLEKLEEEIKVGIVSLKETLAVQGMKAFYYAGRVSWDAKGLDSVVKSNPEVADVIGKYRKVGKEYASFRFDGDKGKAEE